MGTLVASRVSIRISIVHSRLIFLLLTTMEHKKTADKYLAGGMVVSMFLWGLSWPSAKILTRYCTAFNFAEYRYIVVVATLFVLLLVMGTSMRVKRAGIPAIIASGLLLAAYSYSFFIGLKKGYAGAGGVLVTILNPIMSYVIGMIMSRRLPSRREALGLVIGAAAGCILLKLWDNTGLLESGNLYFLLAAVLWAIMSKFTAKGAQYGSSLGFSLWQYVVTLLCLLPFTNFEEMRQVVFITDRLFWINLFFSSAIVTALATTVFFFTTTRLGAEKASSFIFLVPLAAAVSSWVLLGEKILPHTAIGGILGLIAVYIMNKKKKTVVAE